MASFKLLLKSRKLFAFLEIVYLGKGNVNKNSVNVKIKKPLTFSEGAPYALKIEIRVTNINVHCKWHATGQCGVA